MADEVKLVVEMSGDQTTFTSTPELARPQQQQFSAQGIGGPGTAMGTRAPTSSDLNRRLDELITTLRGDITQTPTYADLAEAADLETMAAPAGLSKFEREQQQAQRQQQAEARGGQASALVAGGIAQATGSGALGGLAAETMPGLAKGLGVSAGQLNMAALGVTIASEINNSIVERERRMATGAASSLFGEGVSGIGGAFSMASENLDPLQKYLGINLVKIDDRFRILIETIGLVDQGLLSLANKLSEFSPELAQTGAESELRRMQVEFRRAQQMGPELARYSQVRSELDISIEEIKLTLVQQLLPLATKLAEGTSNLADNVQAFVEALDVQAIADYFDPTGVSGFIVKGHENLFNILTSDELGNMLGFLGGSDFFTTFQEIRERIRKERQEQSGDLQQEILSFLSPSGAASNLVGRDIDNAIEKGTGFTDITRSL